MHPLILAVGAGVAVLGLMELLGRKKEQTDIPTDEAEEEVEEVNNPIVGKQRRVVKKKVVQSEKQPEPESEPAPEPEKVEENQENSEALTGDSESVIHSINEQESS